ncbi:MAG: hypothetical protein J0I20_30400 [Chloroflexi bacterium]|nr:hypothetical protein [Chloroflexota bacterium]MBN9396914.1 hypothetical protein [Candidatus Melainabacteria bacterium]
MPKLQKSVDDGHYYTVTNWGHGPVITYQISKEGSNWLTRYGVGVGEDFSYQYLRELIDLRLAYTGRSGVDDSKEYEDYPFKGGFEHPLFLNLPLTERIRRIQLAITKEQPTPHPRFFYALARIYFIEVKPANHQRGLEYLEKALNFNAWDNGQLLAAAGWLAQLPNYLKKNYLYLVILEQLNLPKILSARSQERVVLSEVILAISKGGLQWFDDPKKAEAKKALLFMAACVDEDTNGTLLSGLLKNIPGDDRLFWLYPVVNYFGDHNRIFNLLDQTLSTFQSEPEYLQSLEGLDYLADQFKKTLAGRIFELYAPYLKGALARKYLKLGQQILGKLLLSKNRELINSGFTFLKQAGNKETVEKLLEETLQYLENKKLLDAANLVAWELLDYITKKQKRYALFQKLYNWGDLSEPLVDKLYYLALELGDTSTVHRICQEHLAREGKGVTVETIVWMLDSAIGYCKSHKQTGETHYPLYLLELVRLYPATLSKTSKTKSNCLVELVQGLIDERFALPPGKYAVLGQMVKANPGLITPQIEPFLQHLEKRGQFEVIKILRPALPSQPVRSTPVPKPFAPAPTSKQSVTDSSRPDKQISASKAQTSGAKNDEKAKPAIPEKNLAEAQTPKTPAPITKPAKLADQAPQVHQPRGRKKSTYSSFADLWAQLEQENNLRKK